MNPVAISIRVVLAHLSPLLQDIIREAVTRENDVEVVATIECGEPCLPVVEALRVDVLIFGGNPETALALAHDAWARCPRTRVLTIEDRGRTAVLHELRPYQVTVGDVSMEHLLAAIRSGPAW